VSDKFPGNLITTGAPAGFSVAFDGNGDSLTAPQGSAFQFPGDFTIECWVYANNSTGATNYDGIFDTRSGNVVSSNSAGINYTPSGYLNMYVGGTNTASSTLLGANKWVHVALVRSGSAVTLYQNGVSVATSTTSTNLSDGYCTIGGFVANGYWNGYISNVRVVKGTALYTATFTPPTQLFPVTNTQLLTCQSPTIRDNSTNNFTITANGDAKVSNFTPFAGYTGFNPALGAAAGGVWTLDQAEYYQANRKWPIYDPYFNQTTLMLHGNGTNGTQNNTFLDSSTNNFTITRNGNATQGTFTPFSQTGWSNYFSGSGDYLSVTGVSGNALGSGDFTIQLVFYLSGTTGQGSNGEIGLVGSGNDTSSKYAIRLQGLSTKVMSWWLNGSANNVVGSTAIALNTWYHVALIRSGSGTNNVKLYLNGVLESQATSTYTIPTDNINIGRVYNNITTELLNGYISNLRMLVGTALYTANFTPPTAPLTAITNTSLLTCQSNRFVDNSTNAATFTITGTPSVQAFSPFAPTAAYSTSLVGGSGYVGGSSSYLTVTSQPLINVNDWTVEFWMYPLSYVTGQGVFGCSNGGGPSPKISWQVNGSTIELIVYSGGFNTILNTPYPTINSWTYVSLSRSSSTGLAYLYYNGVLKTSASCPAATGVTGAFQLFTNGEGGTSGFYGYMSNARVSNTARYTGSNYSIPAALNASDGSTRLLTNFTNAGIYDNTAKNVMETVGTAQISTTQSKWGGSSLKSAASTDYLTGKSIALGGGDFTIECWVYPTSFPGSQNAVLSFGTSDLTSTCIVYLGSAGQLSFYNNLIVATSTSTASANTWTHIAIVRISGTVKLFVNGIQDGSGSNSNNISDVNLQVFRGFGGITTPIIGYIDDLRITKGVARYTTNFTPPTSQLQDQ